jgi:hypothetical protein
MGKAEEENIGGFSSRSDMLVFSSEVEKLFLQSTKDQNPSGLVRLVQNLQALKEPLSSQIKSPIIVQTIFTEENPGYDFEIMIDLCAEKLAKRRTMNLTLSHSQDELKMDDFKKKFELVLTQAINAPWDVTPESAEQLSAISGKPMFSCGYCDQSFVYFDEALKHEFLKHGETDPSVPAFVKERIFGSSAE